MSTNLSRPFLLTGATGFLGKALLAGFRARDCHVVTLGRSQANDIICDLSLSVPVFDRPPALVVHNAGKAHLVPKSSQEERLFFSINATGTLNLLKGLKNLPALPKAIVFVSSVSVYGLTQGERITEEQQVCAKDPYGRSKIQAEELLLSWCDNLKVPLTILRLPLLAGPDPPGNLGAMIAGIRKGYYRNIGGGEARKSMVMATDVAAIIPVAAENPGIYHLTDGHHPSFRELSECIAKQLNVPPPGNIGLGVAKLLGRAGNAVNVLFPGKAPISRSSVVKLTSSLTFDDSKARANLGWNPQRVTDAFRLHIR